MNAIHAMDVASPHPAMPVAARPVSPGGEPGRPFAEVMRAAVSPARTTETKQSHPNAAGVSTATRQPSNPIAMHAGIKSTRSQAAASLPSNATGVEAAGSAGEIDGRSVESSAIASSSSADLNGDMSSTVGAAVASPTVDVSAADQSIAATPQRVKSSNEETETSPGVNARKSTPVPKEVNGSQNPSGTSAISAQMSIANSTEPPILPGMLVATLPAEKSAAHSKDDQVSSQIQSGDVSTGAASSRLHARNPQVDATLVTAETSAHGSGTSIDGMSAMHDQFPYHGVLKEDASSSPTSNTDPAQNENPSANAGASQAAFHGDGVSAQPQTSGMVKNVADTANSSDPVAASPIGNQNYSAKDSTGSNSNAATPSMDTKDGLRSASVSAAISTPGSATKDSQNAHAVPGDASAGLQNGSSVFSPVGHSSPSGGLSSPLTGSTPPRATTADAFTALDSAASGERGVLLHVAPHQVDIGIADPSLGWVEVRAERVSGQIAAALTANSAASHAALTSVLPTMATYLQEHRAGVQQVHVESSLTGGQAGSGSQGQGSQQSEGRTPLGNLTRVNESTNSWNALPAGQSTIAVSSRNYPIYDGHRFSIRA